MNKTVMPHDHAFRSAMANKQVATEFFQSHLPDIVKQTIDFESLYLHPETFVNKELRFTSADVLYEVRIAQQESYIYVLSEHQRNPEPLMPFRVLQYIVAIMEQHRKQHPNENTLPLVVPLVFFNGKNAYPYSADIKDLIAAPRALIDSVLFQPFTLIDTHELSDEQIRKYHWAGLFQLLFKHIDRPELLSWLPAYMPLFQQVEKEGGQEYIIAMMHYLLKASEANDFKNMLNFMKENLTHVIGEKIMTIAEQLRQEGEAALLIRQLQHKFGSGVCQESCRLKF
jgi:predicted transposase/invertase (TIGR01784 family)